MPVTYHSTHVSTLVENGKCSIAKIPPGEQQPESARIRGTRQWDGVEMDFADNTLLAGIQLSFSGLSHWILTFNRSQNKQIHTLTIILRHPAQNKSRFHNGASIVVRKNIKPLRWFKELISPKCSLWTQREQLRETVIKQGTGILTTLWGSWRAKIRKQHLTDCRWGSYGKDKARGPEKMNQREGTSFSRQGTE